MPTYISMLTWSGRAQASIAEVRSSLESRSPFLRMRGMHSVVFLPDEGGCAAVMVATCRDEDETAKLAAAIDPCRHVRVESMLFDEDPGRPAWLRRDPVPLMPRGAAQSLLEAITADA